MVDRGVLAKGRIDTLLGSVILSASSMILPSNGQRALRHSLCGMVSRLQANGALLMKPRMCTLQRIVPFVHAASRSGNTRADYVGKHSISVMWSG